MKKYLLPKEGRFYKANLHAHATGSDGHFTPLEMKAEFKKRGYDVLCISEHEVLKNYYQYSDDDFLFINGYELSITDNKSDEWTENKCAHLNLYCGDKNSVKQVCYNPNAIWFAGDEVKNKVEHYGAICDRVYSIEGVNEVIKEANEHGFIVCMNHPYWSLQEPDELKQYKGLYALEIYNTDNIYQGWSEYDVYAYDIMCRSGMRIAVQMADDNHNHTYDDRFAGTFGGFNMIKAKKLTYESVFSALKNQEFYCSQGPEIYDLYVEDGMAHITCSPAKSVIMATGIRYIKREFDKNGGLITSASFKIADNMKYIRFDVVDENGKRANTRAYFIDECTD
ncbi:MAG: hypothetical protein IJO19_05245 [Clostridia bacterium]|nr:hypothetical protein [Clostridia bacterium]